MATCERPLMKNKSFGALVLAMAVIAIGVIILRICCYQFEYDPKYYTVDYGRFNFFSYFTVQSNLYVCFYLFCLAFAVFGSAGAKRIAYHPMVRLTVMTYILVTGVVYCAGFPLGMSPPLSWDNFQHAMLASVQVLHHMIMPTFVFALFLLPPTDAIIRDKKLPLVAVYPLVYSIFSIVRGALTDPAFYPYPFFRPTFFWNILCKGRELHLPTAYLIMAPFVLAGVCLFPLIALGLAKLHNKRSEQLRRSLSPEVTTA